MFVSKTVRAILGCCVWLALYPSASADDLSMLTSHIAPWVELLHGELEQFTLSGTVRFPLNEQATQVTFQLVKANDDDFDLHLQHSDYEIKLRRRADSIALALPKHQVVFLGAGALPGGDDHLRPLGVVTRLISHGTQLSSVAQLVRTGSASELASLFLSTISPKYSATPTNTGAQHQWTDGDNWLRFDSDSRTVTALLDQVEIVVQCEQSTVPLLAADAWPELRQEQVPRHEIELQLARGLRRALEVVLPGPLLTHPKQRGQQVEHGELRWIEGHRVALLHGTPEQIGAAHAQLLKSESQRCIDSVLYAFGTVQTVVNGRWFRHDLENAYARLATHIPQRHRAETRALAVGLGMEPELVEALNVFPEMFHCSGFAVSGSATIDGRLYHGRVLDYMTTIGLQDAATTFIIAAEGQIPFANVGYAGFTGSVSGMNTEQISLGEMGGRGEGKWDGVPMATLMRRALEECSSLEQVKQLWRESPRTCEYYYVFADGQDNSATGVAATPESVEFIAPGESHRLLGEGIPDAVVLSAGERLQELRRRVQAAHGQIDVAAACQLMSRPVAMESNLHNVLFVPAEGVLYVANATHRQPAAERPYVRLDLQQLVHSINVPAAGPAGPANAGAANAGAATVNAAAVNSLTPVKSTEALSSTSIFCARDSLDIGIEASADARDCLNSLAWPAEEFAVQLELPQDQQGDWLVRFPSARPVGDELNDRVALEWYQARDRDGQPVVAPAAVIVHESGSGMTVGRLIAKSLRFKGIHTFMLQLPYYGVRRGGQAKPQGRQLAEALCQSVVDARRARDAVATLPLIDNQRISLQGTSLGGFVAATTAGLDSAYHRVFILLAGGDLYGVLTEGRRDASKVRQAIMTEGMSDDNFRQLLQPIEPLRLAHRLDRQRVWLFSGRYDDVVPPRSSNLLAAAAGLDDEHHVKLLANHYSGIMFLPMLSEQMSRQMRD
jgi:dienelactone hydrolase